MKTLNEIIKKVYDGRMGRTHICDIEFADIELICEEVARVTIEAVIPDRPFDKDKNEYWTGYNHAIDDGLRKAEAFTSPDKGQSTIPSKIKSSIPKDDESVQLFMMRSLFTIDFSDPMWVQVLNDFKKHLESKPPTQQDSECEHYFVSDKCVHCGAMTFDLVDGKPFDETKPLKCEHEWVKVDSNAYKWDGKDLYLLKSNPPTPQEEECEHDFTFGGDNTACTKCGVYARDIKHTTSTAEELREIDCGMVTQSIAIDRLISTVNALVRMHRKGDKK